MFQKICDLDALRNGYMGYISPSVDGELFLESRVDDVWRIDHSILQTNTSSVSRGFGVRFFADDKVSYGYSSDMSADALHRVCKNLSRPHGAVYGEKQTSSDVQQEYYVASRHECDVDCVAFLSALDMYARSRSSRILNVSAVIATSLQDVCILPAFGEMVSDRRPMVRLSVQVIMRDKSGRTEAGVHSGGGRYALSRLLNEANMRLYVDEAIRHAEVMLVSQDAPAGSMPVVLGNGWTGILLHESVGHSLEGDANYKRASVFHDKMGETIAAAGVTIVDDGTMLDARGSLNVDDEGVPSMKTTLIENGKLCSYMHDKRSAMLLKSSVTGNGRRESYKHMPLPRMRNTYMLGGDASVEDMISSVSHGVYAKSFGGGQVDTASGQFVFAASEAYMIENGHVTYPIKGAMLIGSGGEVLRDIKMIGNDFSLDPGVGTCGKDGQQVPVGVGQSSVLLSKITVGGVSA